MTNSNNEPLFSQFQPVRKEQWKEKIRNELKGGEYDKLIWKTYEGLNIQPFYTPEDLEGLSYLDHFESRPEKRSWENRENIRAGREDEGAKFAAEALHGGASGLAFELAEPGKVDIAKLLDKINLSGTPVSFIVKKSAPQAVRNYFEFLNKKNISPEEINGTLDFDPSTIYSLAGNIKDRLWEELAEVIELTATAPSFRAVTLNSGHFKDSGASVVQEIAFTLNALTWTIEKLNKQGVSPKAIFPNLQLSIPVGVDYFMEIAKLKVFRILVVQLAKAYEVAEYGLENLKIHCYGSLWSKTIFDPSVNLLRDTTEAMSAVIGGCDSLTLEPYDVAFKNPQPFLRRIARNVSTILKEEAYLDKVADPVAGSYYLKNLMDGLLRESWELFQEIEDKGGYEKAFEQKLIQSKIKEVREAKRKRIAVRRDVIVGTNQYPNATEAIEPDNIPNIEEAPEHKALQPQRASRDFEEVRLATERYVKQNGPDKRPKVLLTEYGDNVTMRKARAAFSRDFFGTAGFAIEEGPSVDGNQAAIDQVQKQKADIIVLCSSDDDYAAMGEAFAEKFKASLPDKTLILAGYPAAIVEKLKKAGFDDFIHIRSNAIETLRALQKKLNIH